MLLEENDNWTEVLNCWPRIYRYYAINYPFYQMEPHAHKEWEIMYVIHGRCKITCTALPGEVSGHQHLKEYILKEGEYILLGGGVIHQLTVERSNPCRILNLEGRLELCEHPYQMRQLRKEGMFDGFLHCRDRIATGIDDGRLHETMNGLIRELKSHSAERGPGLMAELLTGQLMLLLAQQLPQSRKNKRNGSIYVRRVLEYLDENYDQEILVADAAKVAGISEGYLQRLFKKDTGETIMDRVLKLRVEKAKLLLEQSTLPIIDIAVNAGFNSRQHFTAVFTKSTGCSPAAWRKYRGNIEVSEGF